MDKSANNIFKFIRHQKLYIVLIVITTLIHISFSLLNQFLQESGLADFVQERSFEGESIIPEEAIVKLLTSNPNFYLLIIFLFLVFIFFCMVGLGLDIVYLYQNYKNKDFIKKTQFIEQPRWNLWDICKVIIIFLFAYNVMYLVHVFLLPSIPYLQDKQNLNIMLSATVIDVIAIGAIFYFVLNEKRQGIASVGLTSRRFFANIRYGVFAYIGLIPILAATMYLTAILFTKFNIPIEPQPVLILLKEEKDTPSLIYMSFFTALLGPVLEEIFFRGFAYSAFKKRLGIFGAIALSAALFAYVHANLASLFPIFCLGILLAYIYEKTGSLIPSITIHALHNSTTLAFLFFLRMISS